MSLREGTPDDAGMTADGVEHLRDLCSSWVEQGVHKALCVLVARRGVVCLHEAYGRLGPGADAPALERDSIFPMLSITKPVTATVVMQLVEDGRIGLTRPVHEYVPEFNGDGKELVCVHNLLTHTSGIAGPIDGPLAYEPGSEMRYTGANYVLLGVIIERVTGRTHVELAHERIFEPLGMHDSSFVLPPEHVSRTIGWNAIPGIGDSTSAEFRAEPTPNTGMHSSARDIAAYGQAFLDGGAPILHPSTVTDMTRDQIPGLGASLSIGSYQRHFAEASWGFGWSIAGNQPWPRWPRFPRGTFSHSGGGGALLWVDPTNEIVGVYLSICRFSRETFDPLSNNDLFVNAVVAATT